MFVGILGGTSGPVGSEEKAPGARTSAVVVTAANNAAAILRCTVIGPGNLDISLL